MVTNPNFKKGVGRLATDRYDFEDHIKGANFRHTADQIDVQTPSEVYGNPATVEQALANVNTFIGGLAGVGQGFITVGDGYDTYHSAGEVLPGAYFDPTVPSLDLLLNPIFATIAAYQSSGNTNVVAPAYQRIKDGGIVVIKAGTYIVKSPITVPPGITLMGEVFGTKIVNATALTIPAFPGVPSVNPTAVPLSIFIISPDLFRFSDGPLSSGDKFMFARETKICNMVICDNFVEPTVTGDVLYLLPQNRASHGTPKPLISQQAGSNLVIEGVKLIGRATVSAGTTVDATEFAIELDITNSAPNGTMLKIHKSMLDGFILAVLFQGQAHSNDYVEVHDCQIRTYAYSNAGNVFATGDNNVSIVGNTIYCDNFAGATTCKNILLPLPEGSAPANKQARAKILVASNNINVDKASNIAIPIAIINNVLAPIPNYATSVAYGNTINDVNDAFDIEVNTNTLLEIDNTTGLNVNTALTTTGATQINNTLHATGLTTLTGGLTVGNNQPANFLAGSTVNLNHVVNVNYIANLHNNALLYMTGEVNYNDTHVTAAGAYTLDQNQATTGVDYVLLVDGTFYGAVTINLPAVNLASTSRRIVHIKDTGNASATNTITIVPNAGTGDTIDGQVSFVISVPYTSLTIFADANSGGWYII